MNIPHATVIADLHRIARLQQRNVEADRYADYAGNTFGRASTAHGALSLAARLDAPRQVGVQVHPQVVHRRVARHGEIVGPRAGLSVERQYGIPNPDEQKLAFYRLLDEFF